METAPLHFSARPSLGNNKKERKKTSKPLLATLRVRSPPFSIRRGVGGKTSRKKGGVRLRMTGATLRDTEAGGKREDSLFLSALVHLRAVKEGRTKPQGEVSDNQRETGEITEKYLLLFLCWVKVWPFFMGSGERVKFPRSSETFYLQRPEFILRKRQEEACSDAPVGNEREEKTHVNRTEKSLMDCNNNKNTTTDCLSSVHAHTVEENRNHPGTGDRAIEKEANARPKRDSGLVPRKRRSRKHLFESS